MFGGVLVLPRFTPFPPGRCVPKRTVHHFEAKFSRSLPWKSNVAPGGSGFTMDLYTNQIRDAENTTARVEAKFSR